MCPVDVSTIKDLAGPIATVLAASAAAFVAYRLGQSKISVARTQAEIAERNWQTSNEKIVLELFERRLAIYEGIRVVIGEVTRGGKAPDELVFQYLTAIDRAPYYFGDEVQGYLETIRLHLIDLELSNSMLANPTVPDRAIWAERRTEHFLGVTGFYKEAPTIFRPYIQAHQKIKNIRLSGGDTPEVQ
jgi:hypothetical protein